MGMAAEVSVFEAIVMAYFIVGSYSMGYFLLRTGWPKIRILEQEYKLGWSIVFGIIFTVFAAIIGFAGMGAGINIIYLFGITTMLMFLAAAGFLTLRRKYFASTRITIGVPKDALATGIIAEKSYQKAMSDKDLIFKKNLSNDKAEKIRQALEKKAG